MYIYDADGEARLGDLPANDQTSQWIIEEYQGSKRIQNCASGNYLSIEHLKSYVEVIKIEPVWMSPRWTFETDPTDGSTILHNVWHTWKVLYIDGGQIKCDRAPTANDTSRWLIELENGSATPSNTPTPLISIPTPSRPAGSRGAAVPWIEYEAEKGQTNGEILTRDRTFGTIASESSGRSAVRLKQVGDYVQFLSQAAANSVVVRYVIPDSDDGTGLEATLSLYVNNIFRQKLRLTSKYAWSYGGEQYTFNSPAAGGAHHFYDEVHALVGEIPAGAKVKLQIDADDNAEFYIVDLVDLEQVAPPKNMPAGYVSIVDLGATPNDGRDDEAPSRQP